MHLLGLCQAEARAFLSIIMQTTKIGTAEKQHSASFKWVASVNDQGIPMPNRVVSEAVLRSQGSVPNDHILIRDHNDPNDPVILRGSTVDLADGTVFYSIPECETQTSRSTCQTSPKIAIGVDDRIEVVIKSTQTGQTIVDLFNLPANAILIRDSESPQDEVVDRASSVDLQLGNVFVTRKEKGLRIIVNKQPFNARDGVLLNMTGAQIAALVFPGRNDVSITWINGDQKIDVPLTGSMEIQNCYEFRVIRKDVNAGFLPARVSRELEILRKGGANVSVVESPQPAVIYHDVPSLINGVEIQTDVMVIIPTSYPAGIPDNAYLPQGSPLLQTAPGSPQETQDLAGKVWQKKSIHPYTGNSRIPWDQNAHGFHTYFGEILCWLNP